MTVEQSTVDAIAARPVAPQRLLIEGAAVDADDGGVREIITPIDGSVLTTVSEATASDVDRAVASARASFEDGRWRRLPPQARKGVLVRLGTLIEQYSLELAVVGARNNGTELRMAMQAEPGSAAATMAFYGEAIDKVSGEIAPAPDDVVALIRREPVGVVGVIVPWNFPMMIGAWKVGAALAAGNSVVLKPPESASLALGRLGELALEAGLPPGVLNIVTGSGHVAGEALATHHDIDIIAFTGSGPTGRRLMESSARSNLKRVQLELGGKSPNVVFADAPDLAVAAHTAVMGIFRNSGQVCVAGSRLLVQDAIADEFEERVVDITRGLTVGNPLDLASDVGAVHSAEQLAGNLAMVERAAERGAEVWTGGERLLEETGGFYMAPTVVGGLTPDDELVRDEVFGPVLTVLRFSDAEEAVALANDSELGLAAGLWTSDLATAHRVSSELRVGSVFVNTYGAPSVTVPLPGVKQSGNGVDKSLHALDQYSNLKTVWMQL